MTTLRHHTVLFDLDGTLLDTIGLIKASLRHALKAHLAWTPDAATLVHGVGTPLRAQMRGHVRAVTGADDPGLVDTLVKAYRAHYGARHDDAVRAFPGAAELLGTLEDRGVRLGVVTSKPHALAYRGLRICGLDGWFSVLIGSDDVRAHKPDPTPVHAALDALGATPDGTLFVGDSPHDLIAGRRAGVRTGAALWGPFDAALLVQEAPTYAIPSLSDVGRLV